MQEDGYVNSYQKRECVGNMFQYQLHGLILLLLVTAWSAAAEESRLVVETDRFSAEFQRGSLVSLTGSEGQVFVRSGGDVMAGELPGVTLHRVAGDHLATIVSGETHLGDGSSRSVTRRYEAFTDLQDATAEASYRVMDESGDLVITQRGATQSAGLWGIGFSVGNIPLDYSIIVPGRSGVRLTATTPGRRHEFDYPIGWEAQLVIIEGPEGGFYVWAEDAKGRYKRLTVQRDHRGWQLHFATINDAPFDQKTTCESVPWHVQVYQGDWRVPARRYRDWATAHFHPTPIQEQRPTWVKDVRAMVIMGLDQTILDALPAQLDPAQTVLYVPTWRAAGYDRDYPTYDQPVDKLKPFVDRAHALGFRIMLHVNYFGVDPLNPAYQKFEPLQCRDPWGDHEKLWWLWKRADPEIKFAYINPASKQWRDFFTRAMVRLCHDYQIDSLHLDQTLAVYNDHNGRIDGMSMIEGSIALHRQLRQALPDVAISGEGLNEITYRHESFAQRHAWGIDHSEGTWDRHRLSIAHPISSYLFRPYVIMNGYLGCAPPTSGQLYAAWKEAYDHWGIIPTLKPSLAELRQPTGFSRQFFDEAHFWQQQRVDIDIDSAWPADVAFPLKTGDGRRVVYTIDGRLKCQDKVISRTVTNENRITASGTIPRWRAFDERQIFGLDRRLWYPYFEEPRDASLFHITAMPDAMVAESVVAHKDIAVVRIVSPVTVVADLVELLDDATVGSRPFDGKPFQSKGPFIAPDGAQFQRLGGDVLGAHPPWKSQTIDQKTGRQETNGTGVAYARYAVHLPAGEQVQFLCDVILSKDAVGQPRADGVTFECTVRAGDQVVQSSIHQATAQPQPLNLDLTALAGKNVTVELTVHPGPSRVPQFDWARWIRPRIERSRQQVADVAVAGSSPWEMAIGSDGPVPLRSVEQGQAMQSMLPGSIFLLRTAPARVSLPVDLAELPRQVTVVNGGGSVELEHPFMKVRSISSTVGGVARSGLFAHPPDRGRREIHLPMTLPDRPAQLQTWIGIRDGSSSTGVVFRIEVNGVVVAEQRMLPGKWQRLLVDLSPWKGATVVISLVTDSDGAYSCDWAQWGEPRIEPRRG